MSASKRDELVQKALTVFYAGGFHAMGMDRIAKETGVSKTAIYKHFRTKEDLILATLRLRDEQFRNQILRRMEAIADTPEGQLIALFDALDEWFKESKFKSCMFIKASSEYQDRTHPIHAVSAEHKRLLFQHFQSLADKAGLTHPERIAHQLLLLKEGAIVMAHMAPDEPHAQTAQKAARTLIDNAKTS